MGGCLSPVAGVRDSELSPLLNASWDEHSFVSWQDGLAERHNRAGIIGNCGGACARLAVRVIWERLVHISVIVAIQSTMLYQA